MDNPISSPNVSNVDKDKSRSLKTETETAQNIIPPLTDILGFLLCSKIIIPDT